MIRGLAAIFGREKQGNVDQVDRHCERGVAIHGPYGAPRPFGLRK
jgi:hypothetical protein